MPVFLAPELAEEWLDPHSVGSPELLDEVSAGAVDVAIATINVRDVTSPVQITVADDFYTFTGPSFTAPAPGVLDNDSVSGANELSAA